MNNLLARHYDEDLVIDPTVDDLNQQLDVDDQHDAFLGGHNTTTLAEHAIRTLREDQLRVLAARLAEYICRSATPLEEASMNIVVRCCELAWNKSSTSQIFGMVALLSYHLAGVSLEPDFQLYPTMVPKTFLYWITSMRLSETQQQHLVERLLNSLSTGILASDDVDACFKLTLTLSYFQLWQLVGFLSRCLSGLLPVRSFDDLNSLPSLSANDSSPTLPHLLEVVSPHAQKILHVDQEEILPAKLIPIPTPSAATFDAFSTLSDLCRKLFTSQLLLWLTLEKDEELQDPEIFKLRREVMHVLRRFDSKSNEYFDENEEGKFWQFYSIAGRIIQAEDASETDGSTRRKRGLRGPQQPYVSTDGSKCLLAADWRTALTTLLKRLNILGTQHQDNCLKSVKVFRAPWLSEWWEKQPINEHTSTISRDGYMLVRTYERKGAFRVHAIMLPIVNMQPGQRRSVPVFLIRDSGERKDARFTFLGRFLGADSRQITANFKGGWNGKAEDNLNEDKSDEGENMHVMNIKSLYSQNNETLVSTPIPPLSLDSFSLSVQDLASLRRHAEDDQDLDHDKRLRMELYKL